MEQILFHGSRTSGLKVLKPRISLDFKPLVYATDDYAYALVRAGKQMDLIREEYYGLNGPFELAECYPDAFKRMFDCDGYIYTVSSKWFKDKGYEFQSEFPVPVTGCLYIPNLWEEMHRPELLGCYSFIQNGNAEYWKSVRGGRDGFIKRKIERKQKMLALRKELEAG